MEKNNLWKNLLYTFLGTSLSILPDYQTWFNQHQW